LYLNGYYQLVKYAAIGGMQFFSGMTVPGNGCLYAWTNLAGHTLTLNGYSDTYLLEARASVIVYLNPPVYTGPPTLSLSASKNPINTGESTTISWVAGNGATAVWDNQANAGVGLSGSTMVAPTATKAYSYQVYRDDGNSSTYDWYTQSITITVQSPNATGTLTASPNPCTSTDGTTCPSKLTWNVVGGSSPKLNWAGAVLPMTLSTLSGNWTTNVPPGGRTYILLNGDGSQLASVSVGAVYPPSGFTFSSVTPKCYAGNPTPYIEAKWSSTIANVGRYYLYRSIPPDSSRVLVGSTTDSYQRSLTFQSIGNVEQIIYLKAFRYDGTWVESVPASLTVTPSNCVNLDATIAPASATVLSSKSQTFTVAPTLNGAPIALTTSGIGLRSVAWSLKSGSTAGALVVDATNALKATYTAGTQSGAYPGEIIATLQYFNQFNKPVATKVATVSVTVPAPVAGAQVTGDVYAGGDITGLKLDANSVVSASGTINGVTGTSLTIPGYTTSNSLQWNKAKAAIHDQAVKLLKERVDAGHVLKDSTGGFTLNGPAFNLNPVSSSPADTRVNATKPEGSVWYVPGNLTIKGPVNFLGRGTLIVNGSVTIQDGDICYADSTECSIGGSSSLGIIADSITAGGANGITIAHTVGQLVGAYFSAGTVVFDPIPEGTSSSQLKIRGLFVANQIQLLRPNVQIDYDSRITTKTPPGFGVVQSPGVRETAP